MINERLKREEEKREGKEEEGVEERKMKETLGGCHLQGSSGMGESKTDALGGMGGLVVWLV
jgi:hypothetical protein